jgi:transketolase
MIGIAVGLSSKGLIPFSSTFAAFLTRAHDQIRMAAISKSNIKICGSHAGVSIGQDGPSQMGIEDLAMMRCLPKSIVMYPSDSISTEKCTELITNHKGIAYIRTTRQKTPQIYKSPKFKIGGSNIIKKSNKDKALVITAGITLHETLKAYQTLKEEGINIRIMDTYSIKPLDVKGIHRNCKGKQIFVIEDHYPEGGLGEAVSSTGLPITHICINKTPRSAKPQKNLQLHGLNAKNIAKKIRTTLKP